MGDYRPAIAPQQAGWDQMPRIHHGPQPGAWDRIIVDQAMAPFEARPVPHRSPPDTICDGWATPDFTVRMASSRGDAHRHSGLPRQDHAVMTLHPATGSLLFAVLDGVASAQHAHRGADVASHAVLGSIWQMLSAGRELDWDRVFADAAAALINDVSCGQRPGETVDDVERRLGTTVVAGTVTTGLAGPLARMARIGDSGVWWMRDREFRPVFGVKNEGALTMSSAVTALPQLPARVESAELLLSRGSVLLIATDGIGDPLGDGTGLVGELLSGALAEPPPLLGFAHLVDFARDTFDDDRTLLAVWPGRPR